ncbi:hypothetical protein LCGC14_2519860 [marine sediment metagenome]|uniref:Uncharacterized protein n=1 Tax=marine sediment metagenome TaxID=412755 RepID=A0A0F9BJP3_9ZZZZ
MDKELTLKDIDKAISLIKPHQSPTFPILRDEIGTLLEGVMINYYSRITGIPIRKIEFDI